MPDAAEHFCTYFDRGFLVHGLALASSLREHCPRHVLWVLCLDTYTEQALAPFASPQLRLISLSQLEDFDPELAGVRHQRKLIEYYFTLSPCWPRFLLQTNPQIERITYLDADLFFFKAPACIFEELGDASILISEHHFPRYLEHHLRFGRFNVGIQVFVNDAVGNACISHWRKQCLEWCQDCVEAGRYADQKYLDQWPGLYQSALVITQHRGVNLAPWNWVSSDVSWRQGHPEFNGNPLIVFHFARFRPIVGTSVFQSGQLEYGIMPWRLRQFVYGRYWRAIETARSELQRASPDYKFEPSCRGWHAFYRALLPRMLFGSDWLRFGSVFISGRLGFGRFSGVLMAWVRARKKRPATESVSLHTTLPFPELPGSPTSKAKPEVETAAHSSSSTFQ